MDLVKLLAKLQTIGVTEEKKPDADKDGVPDWADKKPGADDSEDKEKANEDIMNVIKGLKAIQEGNLEEDDVEEGNEFAKKVQDLKAQGAKPGTKFKTSDGKEHVLEGEGKCDDCGEVHEGSCSKSKMKEESIDEASHQAKTTMKHIKDPTPGEKQAAKDIKPGVAGYKDRIDMLKSAEKDGRLKECDMSPLSSMGGMEQQSSPDRYTLTIQRGDKNLNVTTDNPAELMQLMKLAGVIQGAEQVQQEPAQEQVAKEEWENTPAATNEREPRSHGDIRDWGLPGTAKAKVRYTPGQQGDNPMANESKMFEEYKKFKQGK